MADVDRIRRGIKIRRLIKKRNVQNDVRIKSWIERYDNDAYSRLQFLQAISHSLGIHTEAFQVTSEDNSDRDADASNHESVVNSTPPAIATSTVTAVAACARCALSNLATG